MFCFYLREYWTWKDEIILIRDTMSLTSTAFPLKIIWFLPSQMRQTMASHTSSDNFLPFSQHYLLGRKKLSVGQILCLNCRKRSWVSVERHQDASLLQIIPCCQPVMQKPPAENKKFAWYCSIPQCPPDMNHDVFIRVLSRNTILCQPERARFNREASSNVRQPNPIVWCIFFRSYANNNVVQRRHLTCLPK